MPPRMLVDGLGFEDKPESEDALIRGLTDIDEAARQRKEPLIAMLYGNDTDCDPPTSGIGLGAEDSVLVYSAGDWSGEGGYSKGPRTGDKHEVGFRFGTATNEYLGWMLIPKDQAFAAAIEFFRTGARPTCIQWENM